jgi:hypothetical protein
MGQRADGWGWHGPCIRTIRATNGKNFMQLLATPLYEKLTTTAPSAGGWHDPCRATTMPINHKMELVNINHTNSPKFHHFHYPSNFTFPVYLKFFHAINLHPQQNLIAQKMRISNSC